MMHNVLFDAQMGDGRFIEYKRRVPANLENLSRTIVAMANTAGGLIKFGIDERTGTAVGLEESFETIKSIIEQTIHNYTTGIKYEFTRDVINGMEIVTLEVFKSQLTSYYSRVATSPARQIAYTVKTEDGRHTIENRMEMRYSKVYKYMTIEAFLLSMYSGKWRFFEPSKWNDKFEQRFYCAKYNFTQSQGNTPQVFATCITRVKNSEAAWKVYSYGQGGLGTHCLQLELDILELRKQLRHSTIRFEERTVKYENENVILDLHKKRKKHYNDYFGNFSLDKFLNLLSLKRDAFTYEQEIRLFLIPDTNRKRNNCKTAEHHDLPIQWKDVITKVRIDKKCSPAELLAIQHACFAVGINPKINHPSIVSAVPPHTFKDVDFEMFDIDDMPGTNVITIN